jgi:hypothetical protein
MFILYVMWEGYVLVGQLLALQDGSAVGWIIKQSSINFWQAKAFSHLQNIQTAHTPIHSTLRVEQVGQEANHLLISV